MKRFHLGDILSVTTERLLSPTGMKGVSDLLGYMAADKLYTHQLPRVADEACPYLYEQMPWLREISDDGLTADNYEAWIAALVATHGEYHDVRPMHQEDHERIDPVEEFLRKAGPHTQVISVDLDSGDITVHDDD